MSLNRRGATIVLNKVKQILVSQAKRIVDFVALLYATYAMSIVQFIGSYWSPSRVLAARIFSATIMNGETKSAGRLEKARARMRATCNACTGSPYRKHDVFVHVFALMRTRCIQTSTKVNGKENKRERGKSERERRERKHITK